MSAAKPFTGRHAALIIGGGFAVVIAVNITMAVLATRSFPGLIVENSYVASQKFNSWIAAGKAQQALGWNVAVSTEGDRLVVRTSSARNTPLNGLHAEALLSHPLGAGEPVRITLTEAAPGIYSGTHGLAPGQWQAEIRLTRGNDSHYLKQRLLIAG